VLRDFDGAEHSRRVAEFRALDSGLIAASRLAIAAELDSKRPASGAAVSDESEPGVLQRELKKKTRHMPLRKLFQRIPNLVQRLKPCFLMSPLSVAQYLPPEGRRFDLVVFDEASQIGTHDAIGSIARGGQAVIVGDSRQLPPTAFFQRGDSEDDAPIDDERVDELESVLDEAVAARFPERYLRWHYRSRHESLIRFSNAHYYENRLAVFPAAAGRVAELGVKWRHVADGVYEFGTSRTNPNEARALVEWLVEALRATPAGSRSFGVVTFSQPQQTLVMDLLDEARVKHPEIEPHFDANREEPVFVKNLENVQGDERDEILFSICYGKAADGKVRMNFGPLNQSGGERRLNVAVTRARRALRVFSTLTYDQIDVRRTTARGVHHLREFLRFAQEEAAAAATECAGSGSHSSEFERSVGAALEALGHRVDSQVGCGRYRIDLAVRHPSRPGVHVLGVELDGDAYRSASTARDRDRLRAQVLANLGWTLHRVWSSDWWFDRERETKRLAAAVTAAIAAGERAAAVAPKPAPPPAAAAPPRTQTERDDANDESPGNETEPALLDSYVHAKLGVITRDPERILEPEARVDLERAVFDVVAAESPILRDSVVRDVAKAFAVTRLRERVRAPVEAAIQALVRTGRIALRGEFVWRAGDDPAALTIARGADDRDEWRGLDEIAEEELVAGARRVLARALSLPLPGLVRSTAKAFGATRLSKDAETRLRVAIEQWVARGGARRVGEGDDERIEAIGE
jgi:very-short-patch-repair endonuclease